MEIETTASYTHPEEEDEPNNENNTNQEHVALNHIRASNDEHPIMGEKISSLKTDNLKEEEDPDASDDLYDDDQSEEDEDDDEEEEEEEEVEVEPENLQQQQQQGEEQKSPKPTIASDDEDEDDDTNTNPRKKQKSLASLNTIENPETAPPVQFPTTTTTTTTAPAAAAAVPETTAATAGETVTVAEVSVATAAAAVAVSTATAAVKKPKKKNNNVWTKSTRKGKKKTKSNNHNGTATEDTVLITPIPRFPDRSDDSTDAKICLSKVYKAEKVELSEDRLSAGSSKGYRMVRATRGVVEGAWYFEIKVLKLGETGHTRLGWSMEKGDLQAPVGYDGNSFGYRDIDGSKVHKAVREKYGEEGYVEGDVIGCYINLPDGSGYAPKPPHFVWYKGQRYMCAADGKEESPKVVPGSEISFFKNGVCQGVAFKDLFGGRYYPAGSMYTLPNQPNCVVTFNFGPDFEFFPQDFDGRPIPRPMIEVPYHCFDNRVENSESNEKKQ